MHNARHSFVYFTADNNSFTAWINVEAGSWSNWKLTIYPHTTGVGCAGISALPPGIAILSSADVPLKLIDSIEEVSRTYRWDLLYVEPTGDVRRACNLSSTTGFLPGEKPAEIPVAPPRKPLLHDAFMNENIKKCDLVTLFGINPNEMSRDELLAMIGHMSEHYHPPDRYR